MFRQSPWHWLPRAGGNAGSGVTRGREDAPRPKSRWKGCRSQGTRIRIKLWTTVVFMWVLQKQSLRQGLESKQLTGDVVLGNSGRRWGGRHKGWATKQVSHMGNCKNKGFHTLSPFSMGKC